MFLINKEIQKIDKDFHIVQGLTSLNAQQLSSSKNSSEEATSFLIGGHQDHIPYIYAVLAFEGFNDIYVSDEIIIDSSDMPKVWQEGIDFLEDMGFMLDELDEVSLKDTQAFNLDIAGSVRSNGLTKENNENIISYLSSF